MNHEVTFHQRESEPIRPDCEEILCPNVVSDSGGRDSGAVSSGQGGEEPSGEQGTHRGGREVVSGETEEVGASEECAEEGFGESPERPSEDKMKIPPKAPSASEWRIHRATHVPFRSWCPKCVAARGKRGDHPGSEEPLDETPQVSVDYCF